MDGGIYSRSYYSDSEPIQVNESRIGASSTLLLIPCYPEFIAMPILSSTSAFSSVTALAAQRPIHAAFSWLHANPKTIMDWQIDLAGIPAPTNGEQKRARWLAARFAEAGVSQIETDAAGNVLGILPATKLPPESTGPLILLSAHLDTVFPADTPLHPVFAGDRLEAPGACDNAAGVVGMLAMVHALMRAEVELPAPLVVLGNVGEEGEGDLRGVRHFYEHSALAGRVAAHIVLDGAGADAAVTQALGSRRYRVTITGPGGHSFTDAGTPNPIAALATALAAVAETPLPEEPRTTLNVGTIRGGISVNSIPESAEATVDFRSTDGDQLLRLEVALHRAVEDAVEHWNARSKIASAGITVPVRADGWISRLRRSAIVLQGIWQMIRLCWLCCAPWTGTWACAPTCGWDRQTPIFPWRSAFRRFRWARGEKAAMRTRCTNGIRQGTAS